MQDAFERYAMEVSPTKRGERWEIIRLNKLGRTDLAKIQLSELRTHHVNLWIEEQLKTLKASSINRELNLIASVIEKARKHWKWIATNPIRDADRPKNPTPRDRRISEEEIKRILQSLGYEGRSNVATQRQFIAVAFLFALETAMRQGEIWGMEWDYVHLEQRYVTLPNTKNGTKRDVPLSSEAVLLLKALRPKKQGKVFPYSQQSSGVIFRRSLRLAGIEGLTFHDTRHEALTKLAKKLSMLDLARMVGHNDPRSLMIYYNATASEIAKLLS
ncbi:integrase [Veronia nyctiphanis]|uniref:Integrase n=1 Tax=Veronia nyctiphanis TaxID=1278244 RepID=A0A4Q0YMY4_9GAMM|nr:integrase [Veronia nyctiphanis]